MSHSQVCSNPATDGTRFGMPEIAVSASQLTSVVLALVILLLESCTTVSETEREENHYEREAKLLEAKDDFSIRSKRCKDSGRVMLLKKHSATRAGKNNEYDANDYRLAECMKF